MLTLTRTTKEIVHAGEILAGPFTQVLPIYTDKSPDDALAELIQNRVVKNKTTWFASGDWNTKADSYFPKGAGDYEYSFVESPKTEKRIMVFVSAGFDNYYNDEYTKSGNCEFFTGPYASRELAQVGAKAIINKFVYVEWSCEHDTSDEYQYDCEGEYVSATVVEIDVIP